MTAMRQEAIELVEQMPEDKLTFVIQIMKGVTGLFDNKEQERKEAFEILENVRRKGNIFDYDDELASYRDEKYGN